jgi:YVTN family beta-propeller protein
MAGHHALAFWARGFAPLSAALVLVLAFSAPPAEAPPFAYVTNRTSAGTVSVIDTATNTVVATVGVGSFPLSVAVTPNGQRAYVTNQSSNNVSVIDTATNAVVATVPVGLAPKGVAITPDGKLAYVANGGAAGFVTNPRGSLSMRR